MARLGAVITPGHRDLKVPRQYHYEQPWPSAQAEIRRLAAYKTASDKVACVVRCVRLFSTSTAGRGGVQFSQFLRGTAAFDPERQISPSNLKVGHKMHTYIGQRGSQLVLELAILSMLYPISLGPIIAIFRHEITRLSP